MNFIDKAIACIKSMSADDVIQAMSKIYDEPIERTELEKYPQFIQDTIFIIDLDTELSMEGIGGVLENSSGMYIDKIITALRNIYAENDANLLQQIFNIYKENSEDDSIEELANQLYLYSGFDIWGLLNTYVEKQKQSI